MAKSDRAIEQVGAITSVHQDIPSDWEQWYLNTSDNHFDSIYCNREVMTAQFDDALKRGARINIFGDWFDAMQGRYDKRRAMPELRPEYSRAEKYYDLLVSNSAEWLKPYAENIDVMSDGNHELSVLKHANTNLMDRLVDRLRMENKHCEAVHGGYGGWIRYMFNMSDGLSTGPRTSVKAKYFHGAGGEAPVTRGVIHTNREAVYLPDANIVFNGHNHHAYYVPITRERIGNKGQTYFDIQHHIRIPGYKQSYGDGTTGWDVTRGGVPKPIGAFWTRLYHDGSGNRHTVKVQVIPAMCDPEPVHIESNDIYNGEVYDDDPEGE
jgi:hypothetical protein